MIKPNNKNVLQEIYTTSKESFSVGYVICKNETEILFKILDELGRECALYLIKKERITASAVNTDYLQKIEVYMDYWNKKHYSLMSNMKMPIINEKFILSQILEFVINNNSIVTIRSLDSDNIETGFISKLDNETVLLRCINIEDATIYNEVKILKDNIWLIEFNSIENDVLLYAYKNLRK